MPATVRQQFFSSDFLAQLERLSLVSRRPFRGRVKGERRSPRKGQSVEFSDYRAYGVGDDLRYVDWNVYARLRVPYVKEFEPEEDLEVALFLDASPSMAFGSPQKLGYAREAAAALAYVALRRLESVRVVPVGSSATPRSFHGSADVARAFRFLAGIAAEPDAGPIESRTFRAAASGSRARGLAVVLSDFYDERLAEQAILFLSHRRYRVFAIHVVAPEEIAPRLEGRVRLRDSETGLEMPLDSSAALLRSYRAAFARHCDAIERVCRRREAGYARLVTSDPFETALVRLVKTRHLLR